MARILWYLQWWQFSAWVTAAPVAYEMRSRGHDITFLASSVASSTIDEAGFPFEAEQDIPVHDWSDRGAMPAPLTVMSSQLWDWCNQGIGSRLSETLRVLAGQQYDMVICDAKLIGAGLAAEMAQVPWVSYVDFYYGKHYVPDRSIVGRWNRTRDDLGLAPCAEPEDDGRWVAMSPELILVVGLPPLIDLGERLPRHVKYIGAHVSDVGQCPDVPRWVDQLGKDRAAVLISTSSCWLGDADLVSLAGDCELDRCVDIVATVPARQAVVDPTGHIRQASVLPHSYLLPRVDLVVSSAGLQITSRAALAGKPSVLVPRGGDGYFVGKAAEDLGIATILDAGSLTAHSLRQKVLAALDDGILKRASEQMRVVHSGGDAAMRAADLIEKVALHCASSL